MAHKPDHQPDPSIPALVPDELAPGRDCLPGAHLPGPYAPGAQLQTAHTPECWARYVSDPTLVDSTKKP